MGLTDQHCIPCKGGVEPFNASEIAEQLLRLPGWTACNDNKAITKRFTFRNFKDALECVNTIGIIAEAEQHHPDIALGWGYAVITLQTHTIDGLSVNDFIIAAKINQQVEK